MWRILRESRLSLHCSEASLTLSMFQVGLCWVVAQIGTNLSANVISFANDATSLCPKYINIRYVVPSSLQFDDSRLIAPCHSRRGVIFATITAGWVMVPWKIISSASSLLTFMTGLAIFLAPISSILATDYWLVKRRAIEVPALYRRHARYSYNTQYGTNWRAAVAFLVSLVPNLPGLAMAVNPDIELPDGIVHVYDMNYIYGLVSAAVVYFGLSWAWPAKDTLMEMTVHEDDVVNGVEYTPNVGRVEGEKGPEKMDYEISVESRKKEVELGDV